MNAHYRLKSSITILITALAAVLLIAGCAGREAYKRGVRAEEVKDYETAMQQYGLAVEADPKNVEYKLSFERSRFTAAFDHFQKGRRAFERGDLQEARAEFARALEIDPSHSLAKQEISRIDEILASRAENKPEPGRTFLEMKEQGRTDPGQWLRSQLEPTITTPISLRMSQQARAAFEALAELAGLNVIFDAEFNPQGTIQVELNNVTIFEALDILSMQTRPRSFWKPVNKNTILVAADNTTKRREHEDQIFKTIYLSNSVTSAEITEAITALRSLMNITTIYQNQAINAVLIRETPDKVAIAERILEDIDKSKPEVVIDAIVLEVDRSLLRDLGILPPASTTLTFVPPGVSPPPGQTTTPPTNNVNLRDLGAINSGNFTINIPESTARFVATSTLSKMLQSPRVRATDGRQASLRIGSRIPVAQGSFQPAFAGATGTPVVQVAYIDVGVNLDITPKVLLNRDVSMVVTVQVSAQAGERNLGGVSNPIFTNRSVTHEIRLAEGETNILGGIIQDSEIVTITGIPGLKNIPFLRYFFSQERTDRNETEIIIMLTPHIVRMPDIRDVNMRGVNTGSITNPRLRDDSSAPAPTTPTGSAPAPASPAAPVGSAQPAPATPAAQPPAAVPPVPGAGLQPPAGPGATSGAASDRASPSPAPANATISFTPSPITLASAAPTPISIAMNGANIFGVDLTLSYDPSAISIRQIREGGFLSRDGQLVAVVQNVDTAAGTARVSLERPPGMGPVSGSGSLVTLMLERGDRTGDSTLRITDVKVRDARQNTQAGRPAEVRVTIP